MRHHVAFAVGIKVDAACTAARGLFRTERPATGIILAVLLHRVLKDVVITGHVCGNQDGRATARSNGHEARRVETVAIFAHRGSNACTAFFPLDAPLLVAYAPKDDARMVAVAVYHTFQQAGMFLVDTCQAVFFYHKDTKAVAGIEHFGSHRVMGRTVGIAAELLQFLQSVRLQGIGNADSHSGIVLVHVHAFQFQRLSVQEEALVGIETDMANTDWSDYGIHLPAVLPDTCLHIIKVRSIRAPEMRIQNLGVHFHGTRFAGE